MRQDQQTFLALDSNVPLRGLATSPPTTRLNPSLSPRLLNVTVRDGVIRRRSGYLQLGVRLVGKVLKIIEFGALGANNVTVALTETRQYAYDTSTDAWVDLTEGQLLDTITVVDQENKTFTVASVRPQYVDGYKFSVNTGANAGAYTVASTTATDVLVVEAIPSGVVAGSLVAIDPNITGFFLTPEGNAISAVVLTDVDIAGNGETRKRLLITNGSSFPKTWDGKIATPTTFIRWEPKFPSLTSVKTVAVFKDHLFLGGLNIGGVLELQSIAWSSAGDFDEFTDGSSGIQLLHGAEIALLHLEVLGDRLAIYSHNTIHLATFMGEPAIFAFEAVIPSGTRLASAGAIVSIDLGHVFVAEENFYLFDGSRGLLVIGESIYNDYKRLKDHENLHLLVAFNDHSKRTLFFSVPELAGGSITFTGVYDLSRIREISWSKEKYADNITAFGFFTNRYRYTWDDAPWEPTDMTWGEELGPWGGEGEQVEFPVRVLGSTSGDVFIVTEGVVKDNGVEVKESYETLDFVLPSYQSQLGRAIELEFEAWGEAVDVSYSTDKGQNFVTLQDDFPLVPTPEYYKLLLDVTSRTIRIRFLSLKDFSLSQIRVWVKPGGPR